RKRRRDSIRPKLTSKGSSRGRRASRSSSASRRTGAGGATAATFDAAAFACICRDGIPHDEPSWMRPCAAGATSVEWAPSMNEGTPGEAPARRELERILDFKDLAFLAVGSVIG